MMAKNTRGLEPEKSKYQLIYNNSEGIDRIILDCDKISEIFDYMYIYADGKYLYRYSLKMNGKRLD